MAVDARRPGSARTGNGTSTGRRLPAPVPSVRPTWVTPTGRAVLVAWVAHPVTLLGTGLLLANDHLLKTLWPGPVTGKLSDVAGLVVLPPVLALLVSVLAPRLGATTDATVATAVGGTAFALVKATPTGAYVASAGWSLLTGPSVILADPTDLLTLPALGVAWYAFTRVRARPATRVRLARFGVLVALPAATVAMVATSAPDLPTVEEVGIWRGSVVVRPDNAYPGRRGGDHWWVVEDGGARWRLMTRQEEAEFARDRPGVTVDARQGCVPGEPRRCYRSVPGHLRVEQSTDGGATWGAAWQITDRQREVLSRSLDRGRDGDLASRALAVQAVEGGHLVVVANGRDGVVVRDVTGRWIRYAVKPYSGATVVLAPPPTFAWGRLLPEALAAVAVGLLVFGIGAWPAARRRADGRRRTTPVVTLLLGGFALPLTLVLAVAVAAGYRSDELVSTLAVLLAGLALLGLGAAAVVAVASASGDTLPPRFVPVFLGLGLATTAGFFGAFLIWWQGGLSHRLALVVAVAVVFLLVGGAGRLAHRRRLPPSQAPSGPVPPGPSAGEARRAPTGGTF